MSQVYKSAAGGGGSGAIDTITGNSGGAVPPDSFGNINFTASGGFAVTGTAGTNTLNIAPSSWTSGSIVFASGANAFSQDNSKLFWDDSNNRLGVGTNSPQVGIHALAGARFDLTGGSTLSIQNGSGSELGLFSISGSNPTWKLGNSSSSNVYFEFNGSNSSSQFIKFVDTSGLSKGQIKYDHSANSMSLNVQAVTKALFGTTGLSLKSSSPSAATNLLDVSGAMAIGGAYAAVSTAPSNGLIVEGDVGIGTTTVSSKLHVKKVSGDTAVNPTLQVDTIAETGITASTESPVVLLNLDAASRQWATGSLTTQRFIRVDQPTITFAASSTVTDVATIGIVGAPVQGTNAVVTNSHGLLISSSGVSTATNAYGLTVNAPSGATNSYCSQFLGGNVGIGTSAPSKKLEVEDSAAANREVLQITNNASDGNTRLVIASPGIHTASSGGLSSIFMKSGAPDGTLVTHSIIESQIDATPSGSTIKARLSFRTGTAAQTRMLISGDGNVGIGSSSPINTLDVAGRAAIGSSYAMASTAPSNGLIVQGNVGIGTSSPGTQIHCVGNSRFDIAAGETFAVRNTGGIPLAQVSAATNNPTLKLGSTSAGEAFITFNSANASNQNILFTDAASISQGKIQYHHTNNELYMLVETILSFRMSTTGLSLNSASTAATPLNQLDVAGATAIGSAYAAVSTAPSNGLIVQGNVGIGTTTVSSKLHISKVSGDTAVNPTLQVDTIAETGITASTESPVVLLNLDAASRQWATGSLTTQRFIRVDQPTITFAASSAVTDVATMGIVGAPVEGVNANVTNSHALLISSGSVGSPTNAYGLTVNAPSGGVNPYCAQFIGGNVGIGTSSPVNILDVAESMAIGASYAGTSTAPINGLIVQGSVGIGSNSPGNKVDIAGSAVIGSTFAGTATDTNGLAVEGVLRVGVIGSSVTSAAIEVVSTSQGILFPRMTTTERNAISSPVAGLVIYNTTTNKLNVYTTAWEQITSA